MAIQLNDRDLLIFKLIDEHRVLLEKHISWFISGEDKPVLIRDRLRKLFYLDYLLCHRHGTKLPWWTTPTKPLVYMLSPMSKSLSGAIEEDIDVFDSNVQRHYLEVANLRMLGLMDQKDGHLTNFEWHTVKEGNGDATSIDAKVSFKNNGKQFNLAIMNHPEGNANLISSIENSGVDLVLIVCRDDNHLQALQKQVQQSGSAKRCVFATHHELYREGFAKTNWLTSDEKQAQVFSTAQSQACTAAAWGGMTVAPVV